MFGIVSRKSLGENYRVLSGGILLGILDILNKIFVRVGKDIIGQFY